MKKIIALVIVIVVAGAGFWLASPVWRKKRLDEGLPGLKNTVQDKLNDMDNVTKNKLNQQVDDMKDKVNTMQDLMPGNSPTVLKQADFVARAHDVQGRALLVKNGGDYIIRFEDFKTINGPDLRIYLSSGLGGSDYVDLGAIRATEGNINYAVPAGTDVAKYKNVLVWCRAFSVLFSYAQLD